MNDDGWDLASGAGVTAHGSRYIRLRTRVYDDVLLEAAAAGTRQAVMLGSGLDTRAFRLSLPDDMHVIELDQPGVLAFSRASSARRPQAPAAGIRRWGSISARTGRKH